MRRGPLVQLGRVIVVPAQFHRRVSRLEEDFPGLGRPVVDLLEVRPGRGRDEQVLATSAVPERGQGAVTGAMPAEDAVVDGPVATTTASTSPRPSTA